MARVEGAGVALNVVERGAGAPALVIHGMASDAEAWAGRLVALAGAARAIAYDRRGYGSSGAPEPYTATTVQEQAEDAAAVLVALGAAPALLVGEGFGALVALELLVRRPELASGAVLADPPLFAYVPEATEALAAQRFALEEALREGGPGEAVAVWLGAGAGGGRVARARAAHVGFFADYGGLASWSPSPAQLRGIAVPVAVVTGPASPPSVVAAAEALASRVAGARRVSDGDAVGAALALLAG